ncbi:TonB-dependent receptor [Gammaproteobacteria bacterium]|nr:TonB-dependent receptor [Gammaproteobacteria bacterium]
MGLGSRHFPFGILAVAIALTTFHSTAQAASYVGGLIGAYDAESVADDGVNIDGSPSAIAVYGGYLFNNAYEGFDWGVELRYGTTFDSDTGSFDGSSYELKVKDVYGVFARGQIRTGAFTPYLLGGLAHSEISVDRDGADATKKDDGFAFGAGIDFQLTDSWSLGLDLFAPQSELFQYSFGVKLHL